MDHLTITESLYAGAVVAHVDRDRGILIVWNGSETFRVVRVDDNGWCDDVEVFTSYDAKLDAGESLQSTVHAARMIAAAWWAEQIREESIRE